MSTPLLHLLAGPNGAGKTTFVDRILIPATHLPFVNADHIAARLWPGEASQIAAQERADSLRGLRSFITETVFSHPSKADLVQQAVDFGYLVTLHVLLVPEDVAVSRVNYRVDHGGHTCLRRRFANATGASGHSSPRHETAQPELCSTTTASQRQRSAP